MPTNSSEKPNKKDLNKGAKNYQKSIDNLKKDIDLKLNSPKKKPKPLKKTDKKNKNILKSVNNKDLRKNNPDGEISHFKIERNYEYSIGYQFSSQVITNTISGTQVTTKTNIEAIPIGIDLALSIPSNQRSSLKITSVFKRIIASDNFELNTPFELGLNYNHYPKSNILNSFNLGPSYESLSYVSIANAGSGLKPATFKVLWFDFNIQLNLPNIFTLTNSFGVSYSQSINAENDINANEEEVSYQANKYYLNYKISINQNLSIILGYQGISFLQDNKNEFEGQDDTLFIKLLLI